MISGPALLNTNVPIKGIDTAFSILQIQFKWIFVFIIVICVIEAGKSVYRLIKERL
jgi:hypothetical protein